MPVRNLLALMMVGLMMVPAGAAEETADAETNDNASSQQQTEAEGSTTENPLTAGPPGGETPEPDQNVVCMVMELLSVSCDGLVDADYGSGSGPANSCSGASGCEASIFAPYLDKHAAEGFEEGHVWFCVKTSGC